MKKVADKWNSGETYEHFMGRWSTRLAPEFLRWLNLPRRKIWLDLGCGTGALSEAIATTCHPEYLYCVDPSDEYLATAQSRQLPNTQFLSGSATAIPVPKQGVDVVVSGLALNFFADTRAALAEMTRVLKPHGVLAAYVWDYAGKMEFLRVFWDAAKRTDPKAVALDEGNRFTICSKQALEEAFEQAGLANIQTSFIEISTAFKDFNDFWNPFLSGQGPAPGYVASLNQENKDRLQAEIKQALPIKPDGSIELIARAIAVKSEWQK